MAETYDELRFQMVDGGKFRKRVASGEGKRVFTEISSLKDWIEVDGEKHIRVDKIVSMAIVVVDPDHVPFDVVE